MELENKLHTIDGESLMNIPLKPVNFIVDSLLSQGLHILAGSPKAGKSWLALWLSVMIAKGEAAWGMSVKQGETLYLCLEDSVLRIQNRLFEITEDAPASVHFCTESQTLGKGLDQQLEDFITVHSDAVLIIIDTLQMIRGSTYENTYANDYRDLSILKGIADRHEIAILLIHHLRNEMSNDVFNRISGTTAISGAVDSSFTLIENRRGSGTATLFCIGRNIEYRELAIKRDDDNIRNLVSDSRGPSTLPEEQVVSHIVKLMESRTNYIGTPTELCMQIDPAGLGQITPKKVKRQLLQNVENLRTHGIFFTIRRSNGKRLIDLRHTESVDSADFTGVSETDPIGTDGCSQPHFSS